MVPEFLQGEVAPETIAPVLLELLEVGGATRARQLEAMARIRASLGEAGAAGRVADLAGELLVGRKRTGV